MPPEINLDVPRDGHYQAGWALLDSDGSPLDLTGHTITASAQYMAGVDPVITSAVIDLYDAPHGRFNMTWAGADFAVVDGATEIVRLAWKLRDRAPDGIVMDMARGQIFLQPEIS